MMTALVSLLTLACVALGDPPASAPRAVAPVPPVPPATVAVAPQEAPRAPVDVARAETVARARAAALASGVAVARGAGGPAGDLDPLRKELEIMRLLLDKRVFQKDSTPELGVFWGGAFEVMGGGTEALYAKGSGALFLMRTSDPVAPAGAAPAVTETPKDEWERLEGQMDGVTYIEEEDEPELYDETKVERLRAAVLGTLAEFGARLEHVADDEHVTVLVRGPMPTGTVVASSGTASARAAVEYAVNADRIVMDWGGRRQRTVLSVCVSKSDCTAVAEGRLTPEQFRERAVVSQY